MISSGHSVSIVVPVFNGGKHLKKCLLSVFTQTYKNLTILMILDASTDDSLEIMRRMLEDKSINPFKYRIIEKSVSEKGLGKSRNIAFEQVGSDYIYFLDCDDYLETNAIQELIDVSEKYSVDIACGSHRIIEKGNIIGNVLFAKGVFDDKEIRQTFFLRNNIYSPYVWNKLYKKEFIDSNGLRFPEMILEDGVFTFRELKYASKIAFSNIPIYNYVVHEESITQSILRNDMTLNVAHCALKVRDTIINESETGVIGDAQIIDACVFGIVHIFRDALSSKRISDADKRELVGNALDMPSINIQHFWKLLNYKPRTIFIYMAYNHLPTHLLIFILKIKRLLKK